MIGVPRRYSCRLNQADRLRGRRWVPGGHLRPSAAAHSGMNERFGNAYAASSGLCNQTLPVLGLRRRNCRQGLSGCCRDLILRLM